MLSHEHIPSKINNISQHNIMGFLSPSLSLSLSHLVVFLPSKLHPSECLLWEEALSAEVGCSYLSTGQVVKVTPIYLRSTVVQSVDQLVCQSVIHVLLRVDIILTQNYLKP